MKLDFRKYHGAGNDFILVDDREGRFPAADLQLVQSMCNRRFGIGSDGLLLLQDSDAADVHLEFFNPDGSKSFCGNGSRCGLRMAYDIGMVDSNCRFSAIDGIHDGLIEKDWIHITMQDVDRIEDTGLGWKVETGSPHLIQTVDRLDDIDVEHLGSETRYSETYRENGINVNFVQFHSSKELSIRTYERGVEAETLACGTGVTAAALSLAAVEGTTEGTIAVHAKGGDLSVKFSRKGEGFDKIWLIGPAEFVFNGTYSI